MDEDILFRAQTLSYDKKVFQACWEYICDKKSEKKKINQGVDHIVLYALNYWFIKFRELIGAIKKQPEYKSKKI